MKGWNEMPVDSVGAGLSCSKVDPWQAWEKRNFKSGIGISITNGGKQRVEVAPGIIGEETDSRTRRVIDVPFTMSFAGEVSAGTSTSSTKIMRQIDLSDDDEDEEAVCHVVSKRVAGKYRRHDELLWKYA